MARELPNHEARSNGTEGGCESRSARLFQCARCHALTKICSQCDRGNVYCGVCAIPARKKARQDTSKRYQQSPAGRLNHAARQRRYRERQRLKIQKVTHQGCEKTVNVRVQENDLQSDNEVSNSTILCKKGGNSCGFCGLNCSPFLRRDFRLPSYKPGRKLRATTCNHLVPDTG